jgi:hypothetical protein
MTAESLLRDLGENQTKQWYELYPDRLAEEIELMAKNHPAFALHKQGGKNIYWTGRAVAFRQTDNTELASLEVKIECPRNYPIIFPYAYDVDQVLEARKCPHLTKNPSGPPKICYGNRFDPQLDFFGATRITDVVNYLGIFIAYQWHFERYGTWPKGQPHGEVAFLEQEVKNGPIDPDALCPCAMSDTPYKRCHLPKVATFLYRLDTTLKDDIQKLVFKIGRNDACPCGSGRKSKRCCFDKLNHSSSKFFLLLKYPRTFKVDEKLHTALIQMISA